MQDDDWMREHASRSYRRDGVIDSEAYRVSVVTPSVVADWATGTLEVWLPGYSDYIEETDEQYRIRNLGNGRFLVSTVDGCAARSFKVSVFVAEEQ